MKDNRGVTLIELVIAIAILTSIVFAITSFYVSGVKGFARETTTASNQTEVKRLSNEIAQEIRKSTQAYFFYGNNLVLVNSEDKVVSFLWGVNNTFYVRYGDIQDSNIIIDVSTEKIISDRIKYYDAVVTGDKIVVTLESIENSEGETYKLVTELNLRK